MDPLLHGWPFAAPALAIVLLAWSFGEKRPAGAPSRWSDPAFLLPLLWPAYLLHQFEEHGIDLRGERYAFLGALCHTLGADGTGACPADAAFIFAVNVIACPLAFVLPYLFRRSRPLLAAMGWGVPIVNAVSHLAAAVREGAYNPGLATSVALFIPLGWWVMRTLLASRLLRPGQVGLVVGGGAVLHVVLIGSLQLRVHGLLGAGGLFAVNALNGLVPLALGWWPSGRPVPTPDAGGS